jgi:hypothetical protein
MKQLRVFCYQLMAILIATFVFSCQSNNNNSAPAPVKKYSEYTDLEKDNLRGEVIAVENYINKSICENCQDVTFYNDRGYKEISFSRKTIFDYFDRYIYKNNILSNCINIFISSFNGLISNSITYYQYDSNMNLITALLYSNDNSDYTYKFSYDQNGFPKEEIESDNKKKFYWNHRNLDSIVYLHKNKISGREYFKDGKKSESLWYKDGVLDTEMSHILKYELDSMGNDINLTRNFLNGKTESLTRKIIYKGGDLSEFYNAYIELEERANKINGIKNNDQNRNDFESENNIQPQPKEKEKIICNRCGGTGQKICDGCSGSGEIRCYRCNATGVASDGRRCIYCNVGYNQCKKCYGRTRVSCDGCASRGYTNY